MALHTLKKYPTDNEREGPWVITRDDGRIRLWYYLRKLQALKSEVIVWPDVWGSDVWVITVDGTHSWIEKPTHPDKTGLNTARTTLTHTIRPASTTNWTYRFLIPIFYGWIVLTKPEKVIPAYSVIEV
jgi:hypothetical protein